MGKRLCCCVVYLVFSKGGREGGFCQGRKVSVWKEMQSRIMEWHGNYPSSPGIFWGVCIFFFSEPLQLPYGRGWGQGIHTKTSQWGWNKCANARPRDNTKIAFFVICVWGLNLGNVIKFYLKEMFTLNVYYSREMLCLKLNGSTFSYYGRRGGTSKTSNSIPIKM